jgi:hypothetical protein
MVYNVRVATHDELWAVCRKLPTDFQPYGDRERDEPDCSAGCRWFHALEGQVGFDWGVCANPESPRAGLLTFEHQGCEKFTPSSSRSDKAPE